MYSNNSYENSEKEKWMLKMLDFDDAAEKEEKMFTLVTATTWPSSVYVGKWRYILTSVHGSSKRDVLK